jgi:hypothetical protein
MKTYVMIILVHLFAHWSLPLSVLFLMLLLLSVVYPENPNIGGMMPLVVYHVVPNNFIIFGEKKTTAKLNSQTRLRSHIPEVGEP